jgi:hypothetical protein
MNTYMYTLKQYQGYSIFVPLIRVMFDATGIFDLRVCTMRQYFFGQDKYFKIMKAEYLFLLFYTIVTHSNSPFLRFTCTPPTH